MTTHSISSSTPTAAAEQLLAAGELSATLMALQQQVRKQPGDVRLRTFLFQLLAVLEQWERAASQLKLCGELDAGTLAMVSTYREALQCEAVRQAVMTGRTTPMVFGEPTPWIGAADRGAGSRGQG